MSFKDSISKKEFALIPQHPGDSDYMAMFYSIVSSGNSNPPSRPFGPSDKFIYSYWDQIDTSFWANPVTGPLKLNRVASGNPWYKVVIDEPAAELLLLRWASYVTTENGYTEVLRQIKAKYLILYTPDADKIKGVDIIYDTGSIVNKQLRLSGVMKVDNVKLIKKPDMIMIDASELMLTVSPTVDFIIKTENPGEVLKIHGLSIVNHDTLYNRYYWNPAEGYELVWHNG